MSVIKGYHAHVYYQAEDRAPATMVRAGLKHWFPDLTIGRWHDQPVGPHTKPQFAIELEPNQFAKVVPWLMLQRERLSVLVHPITNDELKDHTINCLWLGEKVSLDLSRL